METLRAGRRSSELNHLVGVRTKRPVHNEPQSRVECGRYEAGSPPADGQRGRRASSECSVRGAVVAAASCPRRWVVSKSFEHWSRMLPGRLREQRPRRSSKDPFARAPTDLVILRVASGMSLALSGVAKNNTANEHNTHQLTLELRPSAQVTAIQCGSYHLHGSAIRHATTPIRSIQVGLPAGCCFDSRVNDDRVGARAITRSFTRARPTIP